jgi:Ca2+-transporting ATPase
MEKAIHQMYGVTARKDLRPHYSLFYEYPLSGNPPIMTHVFKNSVLNPIIAVKGSVEGILKQSKLTKARKKKYWKRRLHLLQKDIVYSE